MRSKNRTNWIEVAKLFPGRTPKQCKDQYTNRSGAKLERKNIEWGIQQLKWVYQYVTLHRKRWGFIAEKYFNNELTGPAIAYQYSVFTRLMDSFEEYGRSVINHQY